MFLDLASDLGTSSQGSLGLRLEQNERQGRDRADLALVIQDGGSVQETVRLLNTRVAGNQTLDAPLRDAP
jgi:hypothetical protein